MQYVIIIILISKRCVKGIPSANRYQNKEENKKNVPLAFGDRSVERHRQRQQLCRSSSNTLIDKSSCRYTPATSD